MVGTCRCKKRFSYRGDGLDITPTGRVGFFSGQVRLNYCSSPFCVRSSVLLRYSDYSDVNDGGKYTINKY